MDMATSMLENGKSQYHIKSFDMHNSTTGMLCDMMYVQLFYNGCKSLSRILDFPAF